MEFTQYYCIVGAGVSGLATAHNLKDHGILFHLIEKEDDVGGLWYYGKPHSAVSQSTHLITSKILTQFPDFPMPESYPDYPGHMQVLSYLRSYARAFELYQHIQFNTSVVHIEQAGHNWQVTLSNGEIRLYGGVIIANGHLWDPKYPEYPGTFQGLTLHSLNYKTPDILHNKRVLIVGPGNSGCDIVADSARHAARTFLSMRQGHYFVPKYIFGMPADQAAEVLLNYHLPLPIRRVVDGWTLKLLWGNTERLGLPKPNHRLYESHPIVNSQVVYYLGHGDVTAKPAVKCLCGDAVAFADGTQEKIDVLIYATGFRISFPFIDLKYLNWRSNCPELYLRVFHPEYDNLFVIGLIESDGGGWAVEHYQANLVAKWICAQNRCQGADWFRQFKRGQQSSLSNGVTYVDTSERYGIYVEHSSYYQQLKHHIHMFK